MNVRLTIEYIIIKVLLPKYILVISDIKRLANIVKKSLGLSSLFVIFISDVIPKILKSIIAEIGAKKVKVINTSNGRSESCVCIPKVIAANTINPIITIFEKKFAIAFLYFIEDILRIKREPITKNIQEKKLDVSIPIIYSLSILMVFISNLIVAYPTK